MMGAKGFESGGASRAQEQMSYGYDLAGNLQSRTNNGMVQSFSVNSLYPVRYGTELDCERIANAAGPRTLPTGERPLSHGVNQLTSVRSGAQRRYRVGTPACLVVCAGAYLLVGCVSRDEMTTTERGALLVASRMVKEKRPLEPGWEAGSARAVSLYDPGRQRSQGPATWRRAYAGDRFLEGDAIQTDRRTECKLYLAQNGPYLLLEPNTAVSLLMLRHRQLDDSNRVAKTIIGLHRGVIRAIRAPLHAESDGFEIDTPELTCRVDGTNAASFSVAASRWLVVVRGAVTCVRRRAHDTRLVTAGSAYDVKAGLVRRATAKEIQDANALDNWLSGW
jgi:uncharacterized protein YaiE (UPF0345 family)